MCVFVCFFVCPSWLPNLPMLTTACVHCWPSRSAKVAMCNKAGAFPLLAVKQRSRTFCFLNWSKTQSNIGGKRQTQSLVSLVWCIVINNPISSSNIVSVDALACSTAYLICCPHTHSAAHLRITAPCRLLCLFVVIKDILRHLVAAQCVSPENFWTKSFGLILPIQENRSTGWLRILVSWPLMVVETSHWKPTAFITGM